MTAEQLRMRLEDEARHRYERYYHMRGGKDLTGHALPAWDGLAELGRCMFRAEAAASLAPI